MPQLACENLCLGYEGKTVLSALSFAVEPGDYLCIVGENGSGKSTLMRAMLRLSAPLSGRVTAGAGLRPRDIGYMPQQTAAQKDFPASVREVVRSGCLASRGMRPFYSGREKQAALRNMRRFGVENLAGRCYRELSGGQQQRVLLARAVGAAGSMLFLDEPAAGLDAAAAAEMYALIKELNGDGLTVVMISHDLALCARYAGKVLHLGQGRALFFGAAADYMQYASVGACGGAGGEGA